MASQAPRGQYTALFSANSFGNFSFAERKVGEESTGRPEIGNISVIQPVSQHSGSDMPYYDLSNHTSVPYIPEIEHGIDLEMYERVHHSKDKQMEEIRNLVGKITRGLKCPVTLKDVQIYKGYEHPKSVLTDEQMREVMNQSFTERVHQLANKSMQKVVENGYFQPRCGGIAKDMSGAENINESYLLQPNTVAPSLKTINLNIDDVRSNEVKSPERKMVASFRLQSDIPFRFIAKENNCLDSSPSRNGVQGCVSSRISVMSRDHSSGLSLAHPRNPCNVANKIHLLRSPKASLVSNSTRMHSQGMSTARSNPSMYSNTQRVLPNSLHSDYGHSPSHHTEQLSSARCMSTSRPFPTPVPLSRFSVNMPSYHC